MVNELQRLARIAASFEREGNIAAGEEITAAMRKIATISRFGHCGACEGDQTEPLPQGAPTALRPGAKSKGYTSAPVPIKDAIAEAQERLDRWVDAGKPEDWIADQRKVLKWMLEEEAHGVTHIASSGATTKIAQMFSRRRSGGRGQIDQLAQAIAMTRKNVAITYGPERVRHIAAMQKQRQALISLLFANGCEDAEDRADEMIRNAR